MAGRHHGAAAHAGAATEATTTRSRHRPGRRRSRRRPCRRGHRPCHPCHPLPPPKPPWPPPKPEPRERRPWKAFQRLFHQVRVNALDRKTLTVREAFTARFVEFRDQCLDLGVQPLGAVHYEHVGAVLPTERQPHRPRLAGGVYVAVGAEDRRQAAAVVVQRLPVQVADHAGHLGGRDVLQLDGVVLHRPGRIDVALVDRQLQEPADTDHVQRRSLDDEAVAAGIGDHADVAGRGRLLLGHHLRERVATAQPAQRIVRLPRAVEQLIDDAGGVAAKQFFNGMTSNSAIAGVRRQESDDLLRHAKSIGVFALEEDSVADHRDRERRTRLALWLPASRRHRRLAGWSQVGAAGAAALAAGS